MTIIKIIGLSLMLIGLIIIFFTLISAKKNNTLSAIRELNRLRTTGYIKEHEEYRGEDVYRNELATSHTRLMSRRAKRVLERMEQEEAPTLPAERAPVIEEIPLKKEAPIPVSNKNAGTGLLPKEEGTAILAPTEESTGLLKEEQEGTALLAEGTALLKEEGTAVLKGDENTAVLGESTGILKDEEGTARLTEEATDILVKEVR